MLKKKVTGRKKINILIIVVIAVVLCTNFFYSYMEKWMFIRPSEPSNYDYVAHFIDVGQGDAIFIKFRSGKTMLVDSGTREYRAKFGTYIGKYLLKSKKFIDYVVLTHPDIDHSGNMEYIIDNYMIGTFFRPARLSSSESDEYGLNNDVYDSIISKLSSKNIETVVNTAGLSLAIDGVTVDWLAPLDDNYSDTNLYSPVIIVDNGKKSLMLTGDIDSSIETQLINEYGNMLDIDILKIAHHGSKYSTSEDFLSKTSPSMSIISVGENTYSHPSDEVLLRILDYDDATGSNLFSNTFTTMMSGNIIISVNNDIHKSTISNISSYSFYDYWMFEVLIIFILLVIFVRPYVIVTYQNIRYVVHNRRYEAMKAKQSNKK